MTKFHAQSFATGTRGGGDKDSPPVHVPGHVPSLGHHHLPLPQAGEEAESFTHDNHLVRAPLILLEVRKDELNESMWSEFDLSKSQ